MSHLLGGIGHGFTQEQFAESRGFGTPSDGDRGQLGESRWVDTGFGFVEQQIWDGENWFATGETHSIPAAPSAPAGRAPPAFSGTQVGLQFQNDLAGAEAKRLASVAAGNLPEAPRRVEQKRILPLGSQQGK